MEIFSQTLAHLYEAAEHTAPDQFPAKVLRVLMPLIHFDGAILKIGEFDTAYCGEMIGRQAHEPGKDEVEQSDHAQGLQDNPAASVFASGLNQPLRCGREALYAEGTLLRLAEFARKHGLRELMLYGDLPAPAASPRWLALYRGAGHGFSEIDAAHLKEMWPHVTQAISMNLKLALNNIDPNRNKRALALINSRGIIELADQRMLDLLELEWPGFTGFCLPDDAMKKLITVNFYRGKRIELSAFYRSGYLACAASPASVICNLAPSELRVAHGFASGMTHSEIASRLGVSPHTVRNQLAQVYQKLGIHGKAELVRLIARS